ncbi:MAG: transcription elongation factor GreA [Gaiellales bacterium]|nr:transcription elongation factor GreA [Gaiellales bacterium]
MDRTRLTAAEMEALRAQLAEMEGPKRAEIVNAIAVARGHGDLSENFEYHAAKNEQGLLERQITILRAKLDNADVIDADELADGTAMVGSRVVIEDEDGEKMEVVISSAGGADAVSPESPMGRAIYGAVPGDTVTVKAPGSSWTARVLSVS